MIRRFLGAPHLLVIGVLTTPAMAQYEVSTPAPQQPASSPSPQSWAEEHVTLIPKNGQTADQQWADRYKCDRWAKAQTGYDPAARTTASPAQAAQGLENYRRAMTACLEAQGYTIQYATSPTVPPPPPAPPAYHAHPMPMMLVKQTVAPSFEYHPLAMQIEGGYSIPEGPNQKNLFKNGWNAGLGLTWYPSSALPIGLRVDGSYSRFGATDAALDSVSQTTGADAAYGHEAVYGGDADLELDLRMGPGVKEYFLGGVGWYRTQTVFRQVSWEPGEICWWRCVPGYFGVPSTLQRTTSDWLKSWNAGVGFEFALDPRASFFVDARYVRTEPYASHSGFVPIRVGLRF